MKKRTNEQQAMHVSRVTIIWNMALTAFKLFAGIFAGSAAMVSDAVHSASDVLSTVIVMIGIRVSSRQADKEHPYGHERFESVAAIILAAILCATGLGIGYRGARNIIGGNYEQLAVPGILALVAAIASIVVKECMYRYTQKTAKRINSGALKADAWHHRSDALSSLGSMTGIIGARLGFPVLDSVACLVICAFIVKAALDIFRDSVKKMTDTACDERFTESVRKTVLEQDGVQAIDSLRTRLFGSKIYIDVDICTDGSSTLYESHAIAERVHDKIESVFPDVKHCMVHVNPFVTKQDENTGD